MAEKTAADLLPLTPATLQLLSSLVRDPGHGYGLKREIEERTGGRVRLGAGTLYTALQRMERDGLIRETATPPQMEDEASSRWRFYEATELGRRVLEAELGRLEADVRLARGALAT
ncbi:MAG: helix-turn-helix transcriptional regulator [Gemmatimonadota bacterium]|jgi:DNA-binding PadR family transcriptional regulator